MLSKLKRLQGNSGSLRNDFAGGAGPKPADAVLILKKSANGVHGSIFRLEPFDVAVGERKPDEMTLTFRRRLASRNAHRHRIPIVAADDHQMLLIGFEENLLRVLKLPIGVGKEFLHGGLHPDQDRALRARRRFPFDDLKPRPIHPAEVRQAGRWVVGASIA